MPKSFYTNESDIPEALKSDYKFDSDKGKWVLQLESDHPTVVKNNELLAQHSTDKGQITRLSNDVAVLKTKSIPDGHVVVKAEEAELLNQVKELGDIKEVKTKLEEHGPLKQKVEAGEKATLFSEAAKAAGYNEQAFRELAEAKNLTPILRDAQVDGNTVKQAYVKVKDAGGNEVEKLLPDYVKESLSVWLPSLQAKQEDTQTHQQGQPQITFPRQPAGDPPKESDLVGQLLAKQAEDQKNNPNPLMPKAAATTPTK